VIGVLVSCVRRRRHWRERGSGRRRLRERGALVLPAGARTTRAHGNVDATELRPDGSRVVVRGARAPTAAKVDCFYVYPTVDLRLDAANHEDFSDLAPRTRRDRAQAARFAEACTLYVPWYRQITIGTYLRSPR